MKALHLHRPAPAEQRPLTLAELPRPRPGPDELVVRVHACGVCRTDLHQVEGDLSLRKAPVDGGYAEYAVVPAAFAYRIDGQQSDEQIAPLLCAGIIGYRALKATGVARGQRLGLYGFGASAHIAIQVARHWGCEVYVFTRSQANQSLATSLGAAWVGDAAQSAPHKLQGAVMFAPAGSLIPAAMENLEKAGTLVLAGIHMTTIPPLDYAKHLYHEKVIRSVANATRNDGAEFLTLATAIGIRTSVHAFPLVEGNKALASLKAGGAGGALVLQVRMS